MYPLALNSLKEGECCCVSSISARSSMRRRLQDLGIVNGTNITCIKVGPKSNIAAFLIKGAIIAIRSEDSSDIIIEKL